MLHRDIELLDPTFKEKIKIFLKKLDEKNIKYYIVETLREKNVQAAYYAQGRTALKEVNELRKKAGLYILTTEKENVKITWTMKSEHLEGKAIDITPRADGPVQKPWWGAPDEKWREIADIAEECELEAGYYWGENKDAPHIQEKKC